MYDTRQKSITQTTAVLPLAEAVIFLSKLILPILELPDVKSHNRQTKRLLRKINRLLSKKLTYHSTMLRFLAQNFRAGSSMKLTPQSPSTEVQIASPKISREKVCGLLD